MSIQIKELLPSDALSEAIEKLNYNFDQLILAGGGPQGPIGLQGIIGPNCAQGDRGSLWYESPTSGTAGAGVPLSIFVKDKILDGDGEVWEYDGANWIDTTINLTGPTGAVGNAGAGGEYLRYPGDFIGGGWVPKANGATQTIADSNDAPNFFGFYDNTDTTAQGVDTFIFGHNQDVTDSVNIGVTGTLPKMVILQANGANGITMSSREIFGIWHLISIYAENEQRERNYHFGKDAVGRHEKNQPPLQQEAHVFHHLRTTQIARRLRADPLD